MSAPLDEQNQEFYRARFGDRYVAVQEQPLRPSRRVRRALKYAHPLTSTDMQLLSAQQDVARRMGLR